MLLKGLIKRFTVVVSTQTNHTQMLDSVNITFVYHFPTEYFGVAPFHRQYPHT